MKMKDLSSAEKWLICCECCKRIDPKDQNRLRNGAISEILLIFPQTSERTIQRIWKHYNSHPHDENFSFEPKRKGHCGRKSNLTVEIESMILEINYGNRGDLTYDMFHAVLYNEGVEVCRKTVYNWCQEIGVYVETSYIKPLLSEKHRMERLRFVLNMIDGTGRSYIDLAHHLHLDEKWFFLQRPCVKRKRFQGQERHDDDNCHHKSHLTKVMFICVIGCPTNDFNGKGAIMPLTEEKIAVKNSKNRPKGTLELKSYSLDAEAFYECMTMEDGVLDVLTPQFDEPVIIQLDNASPHTGKRNIEDLNEHCIENGLNFTFVTQPAQSPDLNFCDGSFHNSLQRRSYVLREGCTTEQELVENVFEAWDNYDQETITHCVYHMYAVYNAILENEGGNQYDPPHAKVREKLLNGEPLNAVTLSVDRIEQLRQMLSAYDRRSDK